MKQFFGKKSRSALVMVLIVSLALHIVAIVIFGAIKFVSEAMREEAVFEAALVEVAPQLEKKHEVNIQQRNKSTPPPQMQTIVVNSPSDLSIPDLDIDLNVDSTAVFMRNAGRFGDGIEGVRKMAVTKNLFGKQVEASKLGVILDVSFSTHNVISFVIAEIQKSFPDALIVFAPGCAMSERKSVIVPVSDYQKTAVNYTGAKFITKNFIDALLKRNEFKKIWEDTDQQNTGYVVFSEITGHHGVAGCDDAMKFLVNNGADLIYWFADFNDNINHESAEEAALYLRRKDAKLMIHDFVPGLPFGNRLETLQMMAEVTGGELFLKTF